MHPVEHGKPHVAQMKGKMLLAPRENTSDMKITGLENYVLEEENYETRLTTTLISNSRCAYCLRNKRNKRIGFQFRNQAILNRNTTYYRQLRQSTHTP